MFNLNKINKIVSQLCSPKDLNDKENDLGFFTISSPNRWCTNKDSNKWISEKIRK